MWGGKSVGGSATLRGRSLITSGIDPCGLMLLTRLLTPPAALSSTCTAHALAKWMAHTAGGQVRGTTSQQPASQPK